MDGIGRVGLRQACEPGRVADDPGEPGQPPQVESVVSQCEEKEDVRLSHVGGTEDDAFRRTTHGDELLGKLVGCPTPRMEEGNAFGNGGRDEPLAGPEGRLNPAMVLYKSNTGHVPGHRLDDLGTVAGLEIGDELIDGEYLFHRCVDDLARRGAGSRH